MFAVLWNRLNTYASIGLAGLPEGEKSKRYAFNVQSLLGAVLTGLFSLFFLVSDFSGLRELWAPVLLGVFFGVLPLVARASVVAAVVVGTAMVIAYFGFITYLLGAESGAFLLMNAGILGGLTVMGPERLGLMVFLCGSALCAMLVSYNVFQTPGLAAQVSAEFQRIAYSGVLICLAIMIFAGVVTLALRVAQSEAALAAEHARSEALLQNLLPAEIAARLKRNPGEVIADGLPAVTLLFADIVDFTPRAAKGRPEEVVAFLNRIFSEFDRLTAERGLEKIKTIGDAYMVAAGLPLAREDHAEIIADMALAMRDAVARLSVEMGEEVQLRIGIHSGPAIAGVIGTSKVFYDVWGDTVNTASRMESHGAPGRIQITAATRDLLGAAYRTSARGPVEIKGVGPMQTWWLDGRRAP